MRIVLPRLRPTQIAGIIVLAVVAACAIYLLVRQNVTSEEARIRKLIREIERAFEDQTVKRCLAVAADDYSDNLGHRSKDDLKDTLRLLFLSVRDIDVAIDEVSIRIRGDEADVSMTISASADGMSLTDMAGYTRYVLAARKENGRWKVLRVEGMD